jgi:hypothetical protein
LEARYYSTCCTCIWTGPVGELDAAESCDISIQDDDEIKNEEKVLSTFDQISKWPILSLLGMYNN